MSRVDRSFVKYPAVGVCGLSCYLCPNHNTDAKSRCEGCKSEGRMGAPCAFLTCAVKNRRIEFCWDCEESGSCKKWQAHRDSGKQADSFKCYQKLEDDIHFIRDHGVDRFVEAQEMRRGLLGELLAGFNDGRSKSYYCIAATVLEPDELRNAIDCARSRSDGLHSKGEEDKEGEALALDAKGKASALDAKGKARVLHAILDDIAQAKGYCLRLRR